MKKSLPSRLLFLIIIFLAFPNYSYAFEPWNISIVADTQSKSSWFFKDVVSDDLAKQNPKMLIHLGDFGITTGVRDMIFRLRGDSIRNNNNPIEFYIINDDDDIDYKESTKQNGIIPMRDDVRNLICWGDTKVIKSGEADGAEIIIKGIKNYGVPSKNESLNSEVWQIPYYCSPKNYKINWENPQKSFPEESFFRQHYSFERGGIRFITTPFPLPNEYKSSEIGGWLKEQICKKSDATATIILTHHPNYIARGENSVIGQEYSSVASPDFFTELIDDLDCTHNLRAVLGGHVHKYTYHKYKDIHLVTTSGMWAGEIAPGHPNWLENQTPLSDYWNATVNIDNIDFKRYEWDGEKFVDQGVIFSIPGMFSSYEYPKQVKNVSVSYSYNLQKGFNFISVPSSEIKYAKDMAEKVGEKFRALASYEDNKWRMYLKKDGNFVGDNFEFDENKGYILLVSGPAEFKIEGFLNSSFTPGDVEEGWHLLSSHYLFKLSGKDNPSVQDVDGVRMVAFMKNGKYSISIVDDGTLIGEDFLIKSGNSYFVRGK